MNKPDPKLRTQKHDKKDLTGITNLQILPVEKVESEKLDTFLFMVIDETSEMPPKQSKKRIQLNLFANVGEVLSE